MVKNSYIKRQEKEAEFEALIEEVDYADEKRTKSKPIWLFRLLLLTLVLPVVALGVNAIFVNCKVSISSEDSIRLVSAPAAATTVKTGTIAIPTGMVKANPFLPYKELKDRATLDVPGFSLVEPPEVLNETSEAARIMDTNVSGILYDKFSPSAILNIEGNDYLVKKGDVINNYKILNIMPDSVTVKLGENVYTAGIGEILTSGVINHNEVSNLNNKFGGVK